jgi:uncharacterized protein (UPF0332 family)
LADHDDGRWVYRTRRQAGRWRTAISRAYYGSFHLVVQMLTSLELKVNRDHGELQRSLLESGHLRAVEAGRILVELHRSRTKADYDLTNAKVRNSRFAQDCVELASDLRRILQEIDTESDR